MMFAHPALLVLAVHLVLAQLPKNDDAWAPVRFLLGEWIGEGGGEPGQGTGGFTFTLDLQEKIVVRRNRAQYAAQNGRPAYSHDDLMILYPQPGARRWRAIFFDNEGHVIHYVVEQPDGRDTVRFVSDVSPSSPRYRLTYRKTGEDSLALRFEIAPPGKPDVFSTYIEAKARRKSGTY